METEATTEDEWQARREQRRKEEQERLETDLSRLPSTCKLTTFASLSIARLIVQSLRKHCAGPPDSSGSGFKVSSTELLKYLHGPLWSLWLPNEVWDLLCRTTKAVVIVDRTHETCLKMTSQCFSGACSEGLIDLALYFIKHHGADPRHPPGVVRATSNGHIEVLKWLLSNFRGISLPRHTWISTGGINSINEDSLAR